MFYFESWPTASTNYILKSLFKTYSLFHMEYFVARSGVFTGFNKFFRKQFNFAKIWFIIFLLDFPPCLIIIFINIFNVCIHCCNMLGFPVGVPVISSTRKWHFRMNTYFWIKIFRITTVFFINFSSIKNNYFFSLTLYVRFVISWRSPNDSSFWLSGLAATYHSSSIFQNLQKLFDLFQPKTEFFPTCALIWVHSKFVHYFSQPIFSLFSNK